jgi:hypothetical protein
MNILQLTVIATGICSAAVIGTADYGHACTSNRRSDFGFGILPVSDSIAPLDSLIWIPASALLPTAAIQVMMNKTVVATDVASIVVGAEIDTDRLLVYTPRTAWLPGANIVVSSDGVELTRFVIAATTSTLSSTPVITSVDVTGAVYGAFSCGEPARVRIRSETADLLMVQDTFEVAPALPLHAIGTGIGVVETDAGTGPQRWGLVAVNLAGHASQSTLVPDFTVPAAVSTCSAQDGAGIGTSWLVTLALCLMRRTRLRT